MLDENKVDCAAGITGTQIRNCITAVRKEVARIPEAETLLAAYQTIGAMTSLSDIEVAEEVAPALLDDSPMVRNRLTLMRLRRCIKDC